jgi:hypothetical protein
MWRRWLGGGIARLKGLETLRFEEEARHSEQYEAIDWVFGTGRDIFAMKESPRVVLVSLSVSARKGRGVWTLHSLPL